MTSNDKCVAQKRETLMTALDSLMGQRENLNDLSRRSDTMREKMQRTEDHPKEQLSECAAPQLNGQQDIVALFINVAVEIEKSIENIRTNVNGTISLID